MNLPNFLSRALMAANSRKEPSKLLKDRIVSDAKAADFWQVPKGKSVERDNWELIAFQLEALNKFRTVEWNEGQGLFVAELKKRKLIEPYKTVTEGFSAVGRMQLPVWRQLGLAWINDKNVPEVTEVGNAFIKMNASDRQTLLAIQLHRYQYWNPTNAAHFSNFKTFPVISLYRILLECGDRVSREELKLFCTRARTFEDADTVSDLISEWREISQESRRKLLGLAENIPSDSNAKSSEGTTLRKVDDDITYLESFLRISPFLEVTRDHVKIIPTSRTKVRKLVRDAFKSAEIIEFLTAQDWLAHYGTRIKGKRTDEPWTQSADARTYYERVGKVDAAAEAYARENITASATTIEKYKRVQIKERILEDLLEADIEKLEDGLVLVRRQYPTASGPIDLLAKDKNDVFVVIELKRGRESDKVVGQVGRYLTWVIERLAKGNSKRVRGIVVGSDFDHKFALSVQQLNTVKTYTFDLLVNYELFNPEKNSKRKPKAKKST